MCIFCFYNNHVFSTVFIYFFLEGVLLGFGSIAVSVVPVADIEGGEIQCEQREEGKNVQGVFRQ